MGRAHIRAPSAGRDELGWCRIGRSRSRIGSAEACNGLPAAMPAASRPSRTILGPAASTRRVCGGSSSSERPSTSWASALAGSMSSSVASMYSSGRSPTAKGLHRPLILVQQGDGVDEGEIFLMIPPRAGPSSRKVRRSAYGFTTAKGRKSRCAWRWSATISSFAAFAIRPSRVRLARCWRAWIARVCSRPSSTGERGSGSSAPRRCRSPSWS